MSVSPVEAKIEVPKEEFLQFKKMDPRTVIALTALLPFQEKGTSITYTNKCTAFSQSPSDYSTPSLIVIPKINYLGIVRTLKGQTRNDIDMLSYAIQTCALWDQPQSEENKHFKTFLHNARPGMTTLAAHYTKKNSKTFAEGLERLKERINRITTKGVKPLNGELENRVNRLKALWTDSDIERFNGIIADMEALDKGNPKIKGLLQQATLIIEQKEKERQKIWKE